MIQAQAKKGWGLRPFLLVLDADCYATNTLFTSFRVFVRLKSDDSIQSSLWYKGRKTLHTVCEWIQGA
jgi:hypothetical protein